MITRPCLLASSILALVGALPVHPQPALPAAASDVAPPTPVGQLSNAARPGAYRLDLTVDPGKPRFSGHVEIDATLALPSRTIDLHGRNLAVHSAAALVGGRTIRATFAQLSPTGNARLTFAEPLPAGPLTLVFDYDAAFGDNASGMHRVKVEGQWYSWTQFESIDARAAFPAFDEPGFKTPFTLTLRTPAKLKAVGNAPEVSTTDEAGLSVHRFAPTLPLPTYLVAMMVGPFAIAEAAVPPTPQRDKPLPLRIVSPQPNAGKLQFALANSQPIVALLEDYFGQSFPFPKLDQITSPIEGGAMENAGADLYDNTIIVLDDSAPTDRKRRFGMVVAHELAHQWFGDLVTPAWWDDIWLNESFANWMGYRIGDAWRPELNIRDGALDEGFRAMDADALLAGRPIRQAIARDTQIDAAFDNITYGKGGQVVAMIAGYMGDAKFQQGVRAYMAAHRYGNATSDDFFSSMATAAGDSRIVQAMRSFTDQQGVPLLTFTGGRKSAYHVVQSRYVAFGETAPSQRWGVPLCVRRDAARSCRLITDEASDITISGAGPLMPNAGGTGYYRFELPRAGWDALIAKAATLDSGEALALTDSLEASVRAGRADIGQLATLAERVVDQRSTYASDAAATALAEFVSNGIVDAAGQAGWQRLQARLYTPRLAQYGLDPRAGAYAKEDAEKSLRRAQFVGRVVASNQGKPVQAQLATAARAYLGGDGAALDAAFFAAAFGVYVDADGLEAAKLLTDKALASEDPEFRPAALKAAAKSGSSQVARWLLALDDKRLRETEKRGLLRDVLANPAARDVGYAWLQGNVETLTKGDSGIFFLARLPEWLNGFCTVEMADNFARVLRPKLADTPGALSLERTIERVRNCAVLKQAKGAQISAAFAKLR